MTIMSLILTCLILIEIVCVQIDYSLFMQEHGHDALNYRSLYITDYTSSLQDIENNHLLIPFQPLEINHQLKKSMFIHVLMLHEFMIMKLLSMTSLLKLCNRKLVQLLNYPISYKKKVTL